MRVLGFEGARQCVLVGPLTRSKYGLNDDDAYYVFPYFGGHSGQDEH